MDNLPNGISADTESTLRNLYGAYLDHEREADRLAGVIAEAEEARRCQRAQAEAALKEYHRRLGRIQREMAKAARGRR